MSKKGAEYIARMADNYGVELPEGELFAGKRVPFAEGARISLQPHVTVPDMFKDGFMEGIKPGVSFLNTIQHAIAARRPEETATIDATVNFTSAQWKAIKNNMHTAKTGQLKDFHLELLAPEQLRRDVGAKILSAESRVNAGMLADTLLPIAVLAKLPGLKTVGDIVRLYVKEEQLEDGSGQTHLSLRHSVARTPNLAEIAWQEEAATMRPKSSNPPPQFNR